MGLDTGFYLPRESESGVPVDDSDRELLDLRNHWEFFDLVSKRGGGTVYEGYDDFYVSSEALGEVADIITSEMDKRGVSEDLIPNEFETAREILEMEYNPDDRWEEMLPAYVSALRHLIHHADHHGSLICAWSA